MTQLIVEYTWKNFRILSIVVDLCTITCDTVHKETAPNFIENIIRMIIETGRDALKLLLSTIPATVHVEIGGRRELENPDAYR